MSEFHDPGPFGPAKDITDPRYWDEIRQLQKRTADYSGIGLVILPVAMPIIVAVVSPVVYPLTGAVFWVALFAGDGLAHLLGLGIGTTPRYVVSLAPAFVSMWFACRWDTWAGRNKLYWIIRHVARNLLFVIATLGLLAAQDSSMHGKSPMQIFTIYSHQEVLYVVLVLLAFFNFILIRDGLAKLLWRRGLEFAWLRPRGME